MSLWWWRQKQWEQWQQQNVMPGQPDLLLVVTALHGNRADLASITDTLHTPPPTCAPKLARCAPQLLKGSA